MTLPGLLHQGCQQHPNKNGLNQWQNGQWNPLSNYFFQQQSEVIALGLLQMGLLKGDRVALLMHSDRQFCLVDMGCLLAGCISVPIDLTQTIENIVFIVQHSGATALVASDSTLLSPIMPFLENVPHLRWIIIDQIDQIKQHELNNINQTEAGQQNATIPLPKACKHQTLPVEWRSLTAIQQVGKAVKTTEKVTQLQTRIQSSDLATIVYIAGEYERPKGVMLSHGAIASNILSAFRVYPHLGTGNTEIALSFLPLTHIFARSFIYGHLAYGHSIYFSSTHQVMRHLKQVQPTIFITVPRFLEKVHRKILEQGQRLNGWQRWLFDWALSLAEQYELGQVPQGWYGIQLQLANQLVFTNWRSPFGSRLKALISGGAALRTPIINVLSAARFPIQQGYGLTETSGVLCYCRGTANQAGSVGLPIPGVQLSIADDGEILVKSPGLMQGYYLNPSYLLPDPPAPQSSLQPTSFTPIPQEIKQPIPISPNYQSIDTEGWFHTGDVGHLSKDGSLWITGVKKPLFKLTTGKYVSAAVVETAMKQSPLVAEAIAVGPNRKFCAMLIWPHFTQLRQQVRAMDLHIPPTTLIHHPCVIALYQRLIDEANCHLPTWSTIKRFALMETPLRATLTTPTTSHPYKSLSIKQPKQPKQPIHRAEILAQFANEIDDLYVPTHPHWTEQEKLAISVSDCLLSDVTCPTDAQSLMQH